MLTSRHFVWIALLFGCSACGDDEAMATGAGGSSSGGSSGGGAPAGGTGGSAGSAGAASPVQELLDLGVTQYFGAADPSRTEEEAGTTIHHFDPADGPRCLRETPYAMSTRDGSSGNLFIYLQGGGACWSTLCAATEEADPSMPTGSLFDPDDPTNPLRDYSAVYVPYCDGSLHSGDAEFDDRTHQGLRNLSAALDVGSDLYPNPERVFLAGSSAGGFGTILGASLVRAKYPDAELMVWNDAGIGVAKPDNPAFVNQLLDEWNVQRFVPASCTGCTDDGHIAPLIEWGMERDLNSRFAMFSSYEDEVIAPLFLGTPGPVWKAEMLEVTGAIHQRHPDRYRRFFIEGSQHTAAGSIDQTQIRGVSVRQWLTGFIDDVSEDWPDTLE